MMAEEQSELEKLRTKQLKEMLLLILKRGIKYGITFEKADNLEDKVLPSKIIVPMDRKSWTIEIDTDCLNDPTQEILTMEKAVVKFYEGVPEYYGKTVKSVCLHDPEGVFLCLQEEFNGLCMRLIEGTDIIQGKQRVFFDMILGV